MAGALLSGARLRDPAPLHRRHPGGRPSDPRRSDLRRVPGRDRFRGGVRHPGSRPPRATRRSPPPRALPRADPRLQGPRPPAPRAPLRLRARALRRDPERPRRDERGHRERRDRGAPGQVERAGVHPVPGGPHEPPPGAPDDDGAGCQRALHRGRGDVRRLPADHEDPLQRRGVQEPLAPRGRQLGQLRAAARPGGVLLPRVAPAGAVRPGRPEPESELQRPHRQLRGRLRGVPRGGDGPAGRAAPPRDQRERHPGPLLPHRGLPAGRGPAHPEPVHGHPGREQLRALRVVAPEPGRVRGPGLHGRLRGGGRGAARAERGRVRPGRAGSRRGGRTAPRRSRRSSAGTGARAASSIRTPRWG